MNKYMSGYSYTYNRSESVVTYQVTGRSNRLLAGLMLPTAVFSTNRSE
jgi:hypothetical protein